MNELDQNWITEGLIDFEYKKYKLLAYLQSCRESFHESKLYPPLGSLVKHYNNLHELNKSLDQLNAMFPKELRGFDFSKLRLEYERQRLEDENISTISEIMEYAMPTMKEVIDEGREIYDLVEKNIEISPVGIMPVYTQEGYLFMSDKHSTDVHVFQYQHSIIVRSEENLRSLSLEYIAHEVRSIANSFENIKLGLIQRFKNLPQPATYLCLSELRLPLLETLLPVTKRVLLTRIFP